MGNQGTESGECWGNGGLNEENMGSGSRTGGNQGGNIRIRVKICGMLEIKVEMQETQCGCSESG